MKPLRLLAFIEASSITGPAKNLLQFAALARGQGVETRIATFTRGETTNLFIETARQSGIAVEIIAERGAYDRGVLRLLSQALERAQPDVLQTHAVKSHFLTRLGGLHRRVPWIAFHHGYTRPAAKVRLYNQLDRWSLRAARKVLTVSRPFRDELAAKGIAADRIEIVHNAIRPDWGTRIGPQEAAALRASLQIEADQKVILIVGRLSREKDHLALLHAVDRLRSRVRPRLLVIGEGPERPRIELEIQRLDLSRFVTLTGQQASAEPYYGIAQLAVLSSLTEGSPNALLEAMAAGVPVVATAVGGIPEIATHGESALLVRPGDTASMAEAMEKLLTDEALAARLAARSRELVQERHTPETRVQRLIDVYRAVSSAKPVSPTR